MSKTFTIFIVGLILFSSCEEIPPIINPIDPNAEPVEPTENTRQILIEEFTGVRCVNCPAGSEAIESLIDIYGERLVVISIHSGTFANPYPESQIDFRKPESEAILDFIGKPIGYPTASINRKVFDGERDLQLEGRNKWAGFVAQEIEAAPILRMEIEKNYTATDRNLDFEVTTTIEANFDAESIRITAMIIENNVADTQLTPEGLENDYVHQHVLREVLTSASGNLLNEDLSVGNSFTRSFSVTLSDDIKVEDAKIIAFVSRSGPDKEVLQAVQEGIVKD